MTGLKIRDITTLDEHVRFENDIQLNWFSQAERNRTLLRNYIFSDTRLDNYISSLELLQMLCEQFVSARPDSNRIVVRATYGHGKSHLALVLANYFGKPFPGEELDIILQKIGDSQKRTWLESFRRNKPTPFLVIRLQGDDPKGLHQKLLTGIEEALREHPAGQGLNLPFWFSSAERFFDSLDGSARPVVESWLRERGTDLAALRERLRERDPSVYELCRSAAAAATPGNIPPDFGAQVSLREVVEWVGTHCGLDKPFPGALIFFDEFSAFIDACATNAVFSAGSPLQDMLNGVSNCPEKVVFVAFSQHDPIEAVRNACKGNPEKEASLTKDLERLPTSCRFHLASALESVVDGYLTQDGERWESFSSDSRVRTRLAEATGTVMKVYSDRYDSATGWGDAKVDEILTRGCFPLHPLTVALLSSVELRQTRGGTTRGVLGFVFHEVRRKQDEAAELQDGAPNWVRPIALVDWFGDMLGEDVWRQYEETLQQTGHAVDDVQSAVLKAMLICSAAQLSPRHIRFVELVSHLTGYGLDRCRQALEQLAKDGYIRHNLSHDTYVFYPPGRGMWVVEDWIKRKLPGTTLDPKDLEEAAEEFKDCLEPQEVPVGFGGGRDWAPEHILLTASSFSAADLLLKKCRCVQVGRLGLEMPSRGYVVWALPETQEELERVRSEGPEVLDSVFDKTGLPVVLAAPRAPAGELVLALKRRKALLSASYDDRRTLGEELVQQAVSENREQVRRDIGELVKSSDAVVAKSLRPAMERDRAGRTVADALTYCYNVAYRQAAPFFTQHNEQSSKLKRAVMIVGRALAMNDVSGAEHALGQPESDLVYKYLRVGGSKDSWGLLDAQLNIREPEEEGVREAWRMLEKTFPPGCGETAVQDVLVTLMNPPFGYTPNKLVLLFCAWFGFRNHYLQLFLNGKAASIGEVLQDSNPKDVVNRLCFIDRAAIKHKDANEEEKQLRELLLRLRQPGLQMGRSEAQRCVEGLESFAKSEGYDASLRKEAQDEVQRLKQALAAASDYERKVESIKQGLQREEPVELIGLLDRLKELPTIRLVRPGAEGAEELRKSILDRLRAQVERRCSEWERLRSITEYTEKESDLRELWGELRGVDDDLARRVETALQRLKDARQKLEQEDADKEAIARLESPLPGSLKGLRDELNTVQGMRVKSEKARNLREKRLKDVRERIAHLENVPRNSGLRLDQASSRQDIRDARDYLIRNQDHFGGSPEAGIVSQLLVRAEALEGVLGKIDAIRHRPPANPSEAQQMLQEVQEIQREQNAHLGPAQRTLIQEEVHRIEGLIREQESRAVSWLEDVKRRAEAASDLPRLLEELSSPPPFLPGAKKTEVDVLRQEVQSRLDQDLSQRILQEFRKITSMVERRRCLEALQQALEEALQEAEA